MISATESREIFILLPALETAGVDSISKLPISIRDAPVLEPVLRNCDGKKVSEANREGTCQLETQGIMRTAEILFVVARIVLQDFTGVLPLVDLAAMCATAVSQARQKSENHQEPLVLVDLVVDHSVQVDFCRHGGFHGAWTGSGIHPGNREIATGA